MAGVNSQVKLQDYITEDFGPSQFMRHLCAITSLTVFLLNFTTYRFSFNNLLDMNVLTAVVWSSQQLLAIFGFSISSGNFATSRFNLILFLYSFFEGVFWVIFWLLVVVLFFGVVGYRIADENGIKQISGTITSTIGAQLL